MLFPIAQMIEGREPPMCVQQSILVKDALQLMMKHGFSQLPVVNRDGHYVGMISERVVAHTYFLLGGSVPILQLTLDHCLERVDPLTPDDDLLEACDRLRDDEFAVVVVDNHKPVGIITSNDMTDFFRRRSEDFIKVEDIEVTLRLRTRDAFPDDEAMDRALMLGLGPHPMNPNRPRREFNDLSLGDMLAVMTHAENWPRFNGMFEPLELFRSLMHEVRMVRNQLAHFRGRGDMVRNSTLRYAMDWLSMRANAPREDGNPARQMMLDKEDIPPRTSENRWDTLRVWLMAQKKIPSGIRVTFRDIEMLLGGLLPKAARKYATWWSNQNRNEAQVQAWTGAGWQVAKVDPLMGEVTFQPLPAAGAGAGSASSPEVQS
ncbi:MAG: CBS domain-containing protein [Chloroflexia bacterium]